MPSNPLKKIVCAGDSITGQSNLACFLKWSHIVECMVEAYRGNSDVQVLNRGIAGNTTTQLLERLSHDVVDEQPQVVVLLIGGNDAGEKLPQSLTQANLQKIMDTLVGAGARVLALQYHVLENPAHPETAWVHLASNNAIIAEAAAERNLPVLNMMPLMQQALEQYSLPELASENDGVHLNPGGELVFARAVFHKLKNLGWLDD